MSWDLFEEIKRIRRDIDRVFSEFMAKPPFKVPVTGFREPLVDVWESNSEVIVEMELPGLKKNDIDLNVTETTLEVKAEVKREVKTEGKGYSLRERRYKGFYRRIQLPVKVDPSKAKASFENGVLEVRLQKAEVPKRFKVSIE